MLFSRTRIFYFGIFGNPTYLRIVKPSNYARRAERLCALLVELRKNAGLRQTELAARLGCPQSFVSKYESGQRRLDLVELEAICKALGVTLAEFAAWFTQQ